VSSAVNGPRRPQTAAELSDLLARVRGDGEWTNGRAQGWWEAHRPETAFTRRGHLEERPGSRGMFEH
jgi:hypothetical protein